MPDEQDRVTDDLRKVRRMLAAGVPPSEVRHRLGFSRKEYRARWEKLIEQAADVRNVWPSFYHSTRSLISDLMAIRQEYAADGKLHSVERVTRQISELHQRIIDTGQQLGVYDSIPTLHQIEHTVKPTLGLFHEGDEVIEDAQLIEHDDDNPVYN